MRKRTDKRAASAQLDFEDHRRSEALKEHGGWRPGAGRKKKRGRRRMPHLPRPALASRFPVHVTVRIGADVPRLRNFKRCKVLRAALVRTCSKPGFRICQFSVQRNHIHLVCEAKNGEALARGVQGFEVSAARRLNALSGRRGSVFDDRYHAEILRSPNQVRNALAYVLNNARKHGEVLRGSTPDLLSSAWHFDGWQDDGWRRGLAPPVGPRCVAPAKTWLLGEGWQTFGLLAVDELPGALGARSRRRA